MEKEKGLKLFGVLINEEENDIMRKSKSLGNLQSCDANNQAVDNGYLSDGGLLQNSRTRIRQERKRGVPWSEEEHRTFLAGLEKLGKGDWRGISRNFVTTRTPTQVASHAQKYFLRQSNPNKKKRRSSLFDVGINDNATLTSSELPTELPLKKIDVASEMTNLQSKETHMVIAPSLIPTQALTQASKASQALSISTNYSDTQHIQNVGFLGETSNSKSATHAIYPDFLQLSLPNFSIQQCATFPSVNNSDLELSIAPPQSPPLPKLPQQHASGAIWVT